MIGLSNPLDSARAILPKRHIFLLSHMRAYTSLFGHIMGSHPLVCGYYEMHIGYFSWKSLMRQKLIYFREEEIKPGFSSMFDKILHDDHYISPHILNRSNAQPIFCLRSPRETIPSILKLYADIDPNNEFNQESFATQYYVKRLTSLRDIASSLQCDFFYFDAESLKQDSQVCLSHLSDWLGLEPPLSPSYQLQKNTSRKRYGDSSTSLEAGHVVSRPSDYGDFAYNARSMDSAMAVYETVREELLRGSARNSVAA